MKLVPSTLVLLLQALRAKFVTWADVAFESNLQPSAPDGIVAESLESDIFSRMSIDLASNSNAEFCQGRGSQRTHHRICVYDRPGDAQMRKLIPKRSTYRINSNTVRE